MSDPLGGVVGWGGVGLLLLATAVLRRRDGRRGWALLDGALAALTGLLLLLVPGPWQLVPTALWSASRRGPDAGLRRRPTARPARPGPPVAHRLVAGDLGRRAGPGALDALRLEGLD